MKQEQRGEPATELATVAVTYHPSSGPVVQRQLYCVDYTTNLHATRNVKGATTIMRHICTLTVKHPQMGLGKAQHVANVLPVLYIKHCYDFMAPTKTFSTIFLQPAYLKPLLPFYSGYCVLAMDRVPSSHHTPPSLKVFQALKTLFA